MIRIVPDPCHPVLRVYVRNVMPFILAVKKNLVVRITNVCRVLHHHVQAMEYAKDRKLPRQIREIVVEPRIPVVASQGITQVVAQVLLGCLLEQVQM